MTFGLPAVARGDCGGARGAYLGHHGAAHGDFDDAPGAARHCHHRAARDNSMEHVSLQ